MRDIYRTVLLPESVSMKRVESFSIGRRTISIGRRGDEFRTIGVQRAR